MDFSSRFPQDIVSSRLQAGQVFMLCRFAGDRNLIPIVTRRLPTTISSLPWWLVSVLAMFRQQRETARRKTLFGPAPPQIKRESNRPLSFV
jgi:hypothetical protein